MHGCTATGASLGFAPRCSKQGKLSETKDSLNKEAKLVEQKTAEPSEVFPYTLTARTLCTDQSLCTADCTCITDSGQYKMAELACRMRKDNGSPSYT